MREYKKQSPEKDKYLAHGIQQPELFFFTKYDVYFDLVKAAFSRKNCENQ